ncbi:hypothetical protein M514_15902 [Trichuris suis]|uniref:Uncharacterized protein n=1 Tax=Trichuris suis TaxID=68888 RepID=A0A085NQP6_9BILA|nr:hypothetical protein M514_15902 [Trichuris suis]
MMHGIQPRLTVSYPAVAALKPQIQDLSEQVAALSVQPSNQPPAAFSRWRMTTGREVGTVDKTPGNADSSGVSLHNDSLTTGQDTKNGQDNRTISIMKYMLIPKGQVL